ncbi:MAG TPA: DUF362 domain-containing protein [Blastocatellia bacterium]|nr:DUF362 domain-containing protein [Blastocatellia bacterium]
MKQKRVYVAGEVITGRLIERVRDAFAFIGGEQIIPIGATVFLKPNLTSPGPTPGVTTRPEFIAAVVEVLRERTNRIIIGESDGGYHSFRAEEAFAGHGLYELARRFDVRLVNLSREPTVIAETIVRGKCVNVELPALLVGGVDVFISLPVPKVHAMTGVSLALKNQWGCLPSPMRLRYHPQFTEMIVAIHKILRPQAAFYDGMYFLDRSGPLVGMPVSMNLLVAANDLGAGDLVCSRIMNIDLRSLWAYRVAWKDGVFPESFEDLHLNQGIDRFRHHRFRLERTIHQWITLAAFRTRLGTRLIYDSMLAEPLHRLYYRLRRIPVVRRVLFEDLEMLPDEK